MSFQISVYHLMCAQVDAVEHSAKSERTDFLLRDLHLARLEVVI